MDERSGGAFKDGLFRDLAVVRLDEPSSPGAPVLIGPFADEAIAGRYADDRFGATGWRVELLELVPRPVYGLPYPTPRFAVVRNLAYHYVDQARIAVDPAYAAMTKIWLQLLIDVDDQLQRLGLSMAARDYLVMNVADDRRQRDESMTERVRVMLPAIAYCSGCGRTTAVREVGKPCAAQIDGSICAGTFRTFRVSGPAAPPTLDEPG